MSSCYETSQECILEQIQAWYNGYEFASPDKRDKNDLKVYSPFLCFFYLKVGTTFIQKSVL